MSTTWILNIVGLLAITVGTLLILLYLWKSPKTAEEWLQSEVKRDYAKHRACLIVGVGLVTVWLAVHYLALILT